MLKLGEIKWTLKQHLEDSLLFSSPKNLSYFDDACLTEKLCHYMFIILNIDVTVTCCA